MKNRFTSVIVITTVVFSFSLLAFTSSKAEIAAIKETRKEMCTPEMKKNCMKDHATCPLGDKDECCDGDSK